MIYLDTSAAMKLVRPEKYSVELSTWIAQHVPVTIVSSVLIEVELLRATRRVIPDHLARAREVLGGVNVFALSAAVVSRAAEYANPLLRSLDAIHLATAEVLASAVAEPLSAFVAYDERLLASAREIGLPAQHPGFTPG